MEALLKEDTLMENFIFYEDYIALVCTSIYQHFGGTCCRHIQGTHT
jgi:hypothetical protein